MHTCSCIQGAMCRQQQLLRHFGGVLLLAIISLLVASVLFVAQTQGRPKRRFFDTRRLLSRIQYIESDTSDIESDTAENYDPHSGGIITATHIKERY